MYGGSKVNFGADIFVTTPHSKPPLHFGRVHRLIIDESHLYEKGADPKLPSTRVFKQRPTDTYMADVVWCVTGTPFSNSLSPKLIHLLLPHGHCSIRDQVFQSLLNLLVLRRHSLRSMHPRQPNSERELQDT